MKQVVLFEDSWVRKFYPIAMTRHVAQIRWGILTIQEKWEKLGFEVSLKSDRPHFHNADEQSTFHCNARWCPSSSTLVHLETLAVGEGWKLDGIVVACRSNQSDWSDVHWSELPESFMGVALQHLSDLFTGAKEQLLADEKYFTHQLPKGEANQIIGSTDALKIAPTAKVYGCFLNTSEGPIIIDEGAEVMEGSMIRGPFYLGKGATLKMGTKIYGPTVIGDHCKVGGEVSNSVFLGYSNKAHDGFIGNAIIGEWCNLGADTNCSNLKNNYSEVKQYSYLHEKEVGTGLTFCGLVMGDHSKCGINTMFNTGTVVGVGANVFGGGFLPKHIPSFYWGDAQHGETYDLKKCLDTIAIVKSRRKLELSENERQLLTDLHANYAYH